MKKHVSFWLVMLLAISLSLPIYSMAADMKMTLRTEDGFSVTTNTPSIKSFAVDNDNNLTIILKDPPILDFGNPYPQITIDTPTACTITNNAYVKANPATDFSFTVRTTTLGATLSSDTTHEGTSIVPNYHGASFVASGNVGIFSWKATDNASPPAPPGRYLAVFNATQGTYTSQLLVMINISEQYKLTLTAGANGSVNPAGITYYDPGTSVTISANANSGYYFIGWSGDAQGTANPLTITMDRDKTITANFSQTLVTQYTLTTSVSPSGAGTVSGAGTYAADTLVTVTATANQGYTFSSWGGDAYGSVNPTTVTMNGNKNVIAYFSAANNNCTRIDWGTQPTIALQAGTEICYVGTVDSGRTLMWIDLYGVTPEIIADVTWIYPDGSSSIGYIVGDKVNTGIRYRVGVPPGDYQVKIKCTAAGSLMIRSYLY